MLLEKAPKQREITCELLLTDLPLNLHGLLSIHMGKMSLWVMNGCAVLKQ